MHFLEFKGRALGQRAARKLNVVRGLAQGTGLRCRLQNLPIWSSRWLRWTIPAQRRPGVDLTPNGSRPALNQSSEAR